MLNKSGLSEKSDLFYTFLLFFINPICQYVFTRFERDEDGSTNIRGVRVYCCSKLEIDTEKIHNSIIQSQSPEQITAMKEGMKKTWVTGYKELSRLYTNWKRYQALTSDGVLIRILTGAGYVSYYRSRGYLGISVAVPLEILAKDQELAESLNQNEELDIEDIDREDD